MVEMVKSTVFREYKQAAANERLVLRTADLVEFISKSKGEKRKELARIIGYEAVTEFRALVTAGVNALQNDPDYIRAKGNQATAQGKLMKLCGAVLADESELYAAAGKLVQPLSPEREIVDGASYATAIESLKGKIAQQEKAKKQFQLRQVKAEAEVLISAVRAAEEAQTRFLPPYDRLVANKEKVKLLDLEQFLAKGKQVLEREIAELGKCPFCGSQVDLPHLMEEIARRLEELAAIRGEFELTKRVKMDWIDRLRDLKRHAEALAAGLPDVPAPPELVLRVRGAVASAAAVEELVEEGFGRYQEIRIKPAVAAAAQQLVESVQAAIRMLEEQLAGLELTKDELEILDTIQKLTDLETAFGEYRANTRTKEAFERQIRTLGKIRDDFVKVQNAAFQRVLDVMSQDISRYYLYLHPPDHENVDDVRLRIVGEEGVEFEYSFHGRKTYPPMKYLSESHLNSLGLALFLASVKLFNQKSGFFVLDDVVTSFDAGHRLRLLRLIEEEFKDWQMILLTHEPHWFDMIKRELGAASWLLQEVDWDPENGVRLRETPKDLRALIELKRSHGHDVANDVRTLLEAILKEICYQLEVKVAFRHNDRNEERVAGELLSELRSTLGRKAPGIKDHPIFKQIETSNLLGTKGSHDRPKEISKGDIDVALEDIDRLEAMFRCGKCGHLVATDWFIPGEKKISCKCGAIKLDWKE